MTGHERIEVARRPKRGLFTVFAVAGALALTACGGGEDHSDSARPLDGFGSEAQAASPFPSERSTARELPKLTFDDLGGGSSIIQVYPGVGNGSADKVFNGTFNDGDSVYAECKTVGRSVQSHPELGEANVQSDQWIQIKGSPGQVQFATAVYVQNPAALLRQLPEC